MRTTRLSWGLLLASAVALSGVVAGVLLLASAVALSGVVKVLAPSGDRERRAIVAPNVPEHVIPGYVSPSNRDKGWPFREHFPLPDPLRMLLY